MSSSACAKQTLSQQSYLSATNISKYACTLLQIVYITYKIYIISVHTLMGTVYEMKYKFVFLYHQHTALTYITEPYTFTSVSLVSSESSSDQVFRSSTNFTSLTWRLCFDLAANLMTACVDTRGTCRRSNLKNKQNIRAVISFI